ncbi:hypothetical protein GXW82_26185 [Streptacidiphilus sp. 4-A2]|nr:hypothetical protein [Streptacidiphilus sp. 4-A2]
MRWRGRWPGRWPPPTCRSPRWSARCGRRAATAIRSTRCSLRSRTAPPLLELDGCRTVIDERDELTGAQAELMVELVVAPGLPPAAGQPRPGGADHRTLSELARGVLERLGAGVAGGSAGATG